MRCGFTVAGMNLPGAMDHACDDRARVMRHRLEYIVARAKRHRDQIRKGAALNAVQIAEIAFR